MKQKDIKRLEKILAHYERICGEFEKLEESLYWQDREQYSERQSVADIVKDFSRNAINEKDKIETALKVIDKT